MPPVSRVITMNDENPIIMPTSSKHEPFPWRKSKNLLCTKQSNSNQFYPTTRKSKSTKAPAFTMFCMVNRRRMNENTCATYTLFVLTIITFGLAVTSIAHCSLLALGLPGDPYGDYSGFGLFSAEDPLFETGTCIPYSLFATPTAPFKCARAFGVIAAVITGLAMLTCVLFFSIPNIPEAVSANLWFLICLSLGFAVPCQLLTFLVYVDQDVMDVIEDGAYVVPGIAGICSATNVILLVVTCILACRIPPPCCMWRDATANHRSVETLEEISEHGTKRTTKMVLNPDGTKTVVSSTTESPPEQSLAYDNTL